MNNKKHFFTVIHSKTREKWIPKKPKQYLVATQSGYLAVVTPGEQGCQIAMLDPVWERKRKTPCNLNPQHNKKDTA